MGLTQWPLSYIIIGLVPVGVLLGVCVCAHMKLVHFNWNMLCV